MLYPDYQMSKNLYLRKGVYRYIILIIISFYADLLYYLYTIGISINIYVYVCSQNKD